MKRFLSIIGFCLFLANTVFAQEAGKVRNCLTYDISGTISQDEIDYFHEIMLKFYKKITDLPCYDTISFLDIYYVRLEDGVPFDCTMIENDDFLHHIVPIRTVNKNIWVRWRKYKIRIKVKNMILSQTCLFNKDMALMGFWLWELGSVTAITNASGAIVQELSYDAWGNLRNPATWSGSITLPNNSNNNTQCLLMPST